MMPLDAKTSDLDDAALMAAFANGDAYAAKALTQRMGPIVFAHAMRMMGNQAEAEDITQDAMMRLWKAAPEWQPDRARVTTWLYRVTANLCIDRLRKLGRQSGDEVPEVIDDSPSVTSQIQTEARADALQSALLKLPERQRQAVVLRHIEELSNPEIADIMDLSVDAVESLTARGKKTLTALLAPQKSALEVSDDTI